MYGLPEVMITCCTSNPSVHCNCIIVYCSALVSTKLLVLLVKLLVVLLPQHKCYVVATCDRDLKRRIRKIPGVPIMYITQHRYSIERMPDAYGGTATVILWSTAPYLLVSPHSTKAIAYASNPWTHISSPITFVLCICVITFGHVLSMIRK